MLRTRRSRIITLLALAVFGSGWVKIPVPQFLLPERLDWHGNQVDLKLSHVSLTWAVGKLEAREVHATINGKRVLTAPSASVHIGFMPLHRKFGRAHLVKLVGPEISIDQALLDSLEQAQPSDGQRKRFPRVAFSVLGGKLNWNMDSGQRLAWEVDQLSGVLAKQRSDVQLSGRMTEPVQSYVTGKASAERGLQSWWLTLEGENTTAEDSWQPQDIKVLRGVEIAPGDYSFRFAAAAQSGQRLRTNLELNLLKAEVKLADPPLQVSELTLRASGGLREGVRAEVSGVVDGDFRLLAQGNMQWPEGEQPWMALRGDTTAVLVDQNRLDWVRLLHPITADILEGLEVRGGPEARFSVDWQRGTPVAWGVHADTSGMRMRYRGIVTSSGDKPAFPYPVLATRGDFTAAGRWLLVDVEGVAGTGTMQGKGAVEIRSEDTGVYMDIHADQVAIDREVRAAAAGTFEIAKLWHELGIPKGGTADVDIRVRTDNASEHVGLTISGSARGARIHPRELPLPALVERADFFWTDGYSAFDATATSTQSRVRLHGELRAAVDQEFPSLRAIVEGDNLRPDLRTRRVLTERLELPAWLPRFAPVGDSTTRLSYNQPAIAESGQLLLQVEAKDLDLGFGTAFGSRFVSLLSMDSVNGPFQMLSSSDQSRFLAPQLRANFAGQPLSATFEGGGEQQSDGILLESAELYLPPAASKAIGALLKIDPALQALQVDCTSKILLDWRGNSDDPLHARLSLSPLRVLQADGSDPLELYGEITVDGEELRASRFRLQRGEGWVELRDLVFFFGPDHQHLSAVVDSAQGIRLDPRLFDLLGSDAARAFQELRLAGELAPKSVPIEYSRIEDQAATLKIGAGQVELREMSIHGPPSVSAGNAEIEFDELLWREGIGLTGDVLVRRGSAIVSGIPVREVYGVLRLLPDSIELSDFGGKTLGGWVRARQPKEAGEAFGILAAQLTPGVPVTAQLEFGDIRLEELQTPLGVEPSGNGKLQGWIDLKSASLSPLDYSGRGRIEVSNGRLPTVPILEQLWGLLGVDSPVFRRGDVRFRMAGDARVRIEEFTLGHDLLSVEGKGWIHMDGTVQLKVSLRRVRLLLGLPVTDLPIVSQFFDLFIEQEVYGPIDRLQLKNRAGRKLLGKELPRVPTPLWIPDREAPSSSLSPVLPQHLVEADVAPAQGDG